MYIPGQGTSGALSSSSFGGYRHIGRPVWVPPLPSYVFFVQGAKVESTLFRSTIFGKNSTLLSSTLMRRVVFDKIEKSTLLKILVVQEIERSTLLKRVVV